MKSKITNRGFKVIEFEDCGGESCSLQESSSFEPRIWLGKNNVKPRLFLPDIDPNKTGWIDYPIPEAVHIFARMELDQEQVKELLPYLEYFSEHGCLPSRYIDK